MFRIIISRKNKLNSKTAVLAFILLITLLALAVQAEVLEDKTNGFRLQYPSDWQVTKFPNSADLVKANINKDKSAGLQVRIYSKFHRSDARLFRSKYLLLEKNSVTINGKAGFVISFDLARGDGSRWFLKQFLIPRGSSVYVLQSGTVLESREENEPLLDGIGNSLEFIE